MLAIFVLVSLCGLFLTGAANVTATMFQPAKVVCPSVRVVNLGIYVFYDESFVENRKRINATENITEYLSILVKAAEEQHFWNISCTNVTFLLIGASALDNSSDIEELDEYHLLDVEKTLGKLEEYWSSQRYDLGNPDVGVLFTAHTLVNNSEKCHAVRENVSQPDFDRRFQEPPEYRAYCAYITGAAFYKGLCGNNSVAVVEENGGVFQGTTGLARAIATLFGVGFDIFREEEECRGDYRQYFTSISSQFVVSPDLSPCAKAELTSFIDCPSDPSLVCWNDTVDAAVISEHKTPYDFFQKHDFCGRSYFESYQCPGDRNVSDYKDCHRRCCEKDSDDVEFVYASIFTPYGLVCEGNGICFSDRCFKKNVS